MVTVRIAVLYYKTAIRAFYKYCLDMMQVEGVLAVNDLVQILLENRTVLLQVLKPLKIFIQG